LQQPVAEYADRLAAVARQYPFQWFNIYSFWEETPAGNQPDAHANVAPDPVRNVP